MASYTGFILDLPDFYQQTLSPTLEVPLEPFYPYSLVDIDEFFPVFGDKVHTGATARTTRSLSGFILPTYADDLFGHILVVPARLDMGNLLSNQVRTIELANLFLEDRSFEDAVNNAGAGIGFGNLPDFPHTIVPFGSYFVQVSVSADGPPSINGSLFFDFDEGDVTVPVTGQRITMFPWIPEVPVKEVIDWATDVIEAYDGTEQRHSIRLAPRQLLSYEVLVIDPIEDMKMRGVLFDWLPRVWGVPIWWEQRSLSSPLIPGATILEVITAYGDFRVGGLVAVVEEINGRLQFEAFEIEEINEFTIQLTSGVVNTYSKLATVMPVRTAYASTNVSTQRYRTGEEVVNIEFTTLDNEDLSDATGSTLYQNRVILLDPNLSDGQLPEAMERPVLVIDNDAGRIFQMSRTDRSRIRSRKQWSIHTLQELWRVRRLLHTFRGSQKGFFIPTFRKDLRLVETIGPGASSFTIQNIGFTQYVQSRRPYGDVLIRKVDGTQIVRQILSSSVDEDEETIVVSSSISATAITVDEVYRIELVTLVRISDDKATLLHSGGGESVASINTVSIKE